VAPLPLHHQLHSALAPALSYHALLLDPHTRNECPPLLTCSGPGSVVAVWGSVPGAGNCWGFFRRAARDRPRVPPGHDDVGPASGLGHGCYDRYPGLGLRLRSSLASAARTCCRAHAAGGAWSRCWRNVVRGGRIRWSAGAFVRATSEWAQSNGTSAVRDRHGAVPSAAFAGRKTLAYHPAHETLLASTRDYLYFCARENLIRGVFGDDFG